MGHCFPLKAFCLWKMAGGKKKLYFPTNSPVEKKSLLKNFIKLGEIGFEHELLIPHVSESWCVKMTLKS